MKKLLMAVLISAASASSSAASLVGCDSGISDSGEAGWIGTYQDGGRIFKLFFPLSTFSTCPPFVG